MFLDVKPDNILVTLTDPEQVINEHLANTRVIMRPVKSPSPHMPRFIIQSQPIPLDIERCIEDPNVVYKLADFGMCELLLSVRKGWN